MTAEALTKEADGGGVGGDSVIKGSHSKQKETGKLLQVKDDKEGPRKRRKRRDSGDDQVSIESIEDYIPTPPDGGWGWVIVCSSIVCNLIVDGIGYSFGVFLNDFVEAFKEPKSKVSLVGSLLCGTYLFAGPIVSAITNKFGCRPVIIAGSIIATVAFVLATFSNGVLMLIVTYGVIGGFGLGMIYLPAIVSVGYYFEKKRAFATGLAVAGSGLGTFIFPPLSQFLIDELTWRGGILIIAGIILNAAICGCLMRPLTVKKKPEKSKDKPRSKTMLDRIKETTRDRTISESDSAVHYVKDNNTILQGVMQAKLYRENNLQDNDSDLGSLPSIAFVKRGDSMSAGDHRRFRIKKKLKIQLKDPYDNHKIMKLGGSIPIPNDPNRHKLSVSSTAESMTTNSPARDIQGSPSSHVMGSPCIPASSIKEESDKLDSRVGKVSPDPDSETKVSEMAESIGTSEYFTPPVSPSATTPSSPVNETNPSSPVNEKTLLGKPQKPDEVKNGTIPAIGSEFSPLLEVPAPVIKIGGNRAGSYGGSRTNMLHLQSLNSLHVSKKDLARPMYRKDIFYSGSVLNIPQYKSQTDMKSYITSITTIPGEMEFVDGPSPSSKCINIVCSCLPRSARDILSEMIDISLLKDISFMLICLGNITAFLGFYIPFMFLVDRAVNLDIDKSDAAFLISIIGITNTVGRVMVGKLADLHIIDSLIITYVSIALCGVVTALVPFCNTYPLLATNAAVFGLGMAAFISLSSIVICDRMGLEKLTNAFGLLSMVRGIAGMAGPPLAGFMYDATGDYDLSFYIGGLLLFAGAGCHCLLHLSCLRKTKQKEFIYDEPTEEILQIIGSKPQILTVDQALSSV